MCEAVKEELESDGGTQISMIGLEYTELSLSWIMKKILEYICNFFFYKKKTYYLTLSIIKRGE